MEFILKFITPLVPNFIFRLDLFIQGEHYRQNKKFTRTNQHVIVSFFFFLFNYLTKHMYLIIQKSLRYSPSDMDNPI